MCIGADHQSHAYVGAPAAALDLDGLAPYLCHHSKQMAQLHEGTTAATAEHPFQQFRLGVVGVVVDGQDDGLMARRTVTEMK